MTVSAEEIQRLKDELPGKLVERVRSATQTWLELKTSLLKGLTDFEKESLAELRDIDAQLLKLDEPTTPPLPWYKFAAKEQQALDKKVVMQELAARLKRVQLAYDKQHDVVVEVDLAELKMIALLLMLIQLDPILGLALTNEIHDNARAFIDAKKAAASEAPAAPPASDA